jgi:hypothetical protein
MVAKLCEVMVMLPSAISTKPAQWIKVGGSKKKLSLEKKTLHIDLL